MEPIRIFLVVMSCSPSALSCENLSDAIFYSDMKACHAARAEALRPPEEATTQRLVFARCQYVLIDDESRKELAGAEWRSADRLSW